MKKGPRAQLRLARKKTHKANLRNKELALENRRLREALRLCQEPKED